MQLRELLSALKMNGALEILEELSEIDDKEDYVKALLSAEYHHRQQHLMKRRLAVAHFPVEKEWDDLDETLNPSIEFGKVKALSSGDFIDRCENACILGTQGTGKTHSLISLGRALCRKGYAVRFYTACALVNLLEEAKANNQLTKAMAMLMKPKLLIIDELGFVPFSENGARLLFDVFSSRYERGSIAVSTNLAFNKWGQIFGTVELTAALVDRFTHRAHIFTYEGHSVRFQHAKKQQQLNQQKENHA
jgi:DNA replication protein DnaC